MNDTLVITEEIENLLRNLKGDIACLQCSHKVHTVGYQKARKCIDAINETLEKYETKS